MHQLLALKGIEGIFGLHVHELQLWVLRTFEEVVISHVGRWIVYLICNLNKLLAQCRTTISFKIVRKSLTSFMIDEKIFLMLGLLDAEKVQGFA